MYHPPTHPSVENWTDEAAKAAVYAAERRCSEHHGAMPWAEPGIAAVFGNDGYRNNFAAQAIVGLFREKMRSSGIRVLGFGLDQDGNTWALLVESDDVQFLRQTALDAWKVASESDPNDLEWQLLQRLREVSGDAPDAEYEST